MKHLDHLITWVKTAGAPTEQSTDFDGFLSWHAETHATSMGIAAGFMAAAFSEYSLLGAAYAAAAHGRIAQSNGRRKVWKDLRAEPHYALAGIVVGAVLGAATRLVLG